MCQRAIICILYKIHVVIKNTTQNIRITHGNNLAVYHIFFNFAT